MYELEIDNDLLDIQQHYQSRIEGLQQAASQNHRSFFEYNNPLILFEQQLARETEVLQLQVDTLSAFLTQHKTPTEREAHLAELNATYQASLKQLIDDLIIGLCEYYKARGEQIFADGQLKTLTKSGLAEVIKNALDYLHETEFQSYRTFQFTTRNVTDMQVAQWQGQIQIRIDHVAELQKTKIEKGEHWQLTDIKLKKGLRSTKEQASKAKQVYQQSLIYLSGHGDLAAVQACVAQQKALLTTAVKDKKQRAEAFSQWLNVTTDNGKTALAQACLYGRLDTVRYLLAEGAKAQQFAKNAFEIMYAPLHFACFFERENTAELIETLLTHHVDNRASANQTAERLRTPLHTAAICNNMSAINTLLKYGARVDAKTIDTGNTPLHDAVMKGYLACVKVLIENSNSALWFLRNQQRETPLMTALIFNQPLVVTYLYQQGVWLSQADLNALQSDPIIIKTLPHVFTLIRTTLQSTLDTIKIVANKPNALPELPSSKNAVALKDSLGTLNFFNSMTDKTEHALSNLLQTTGLRYEKVPGDGHCLYHAVGLYLGQTQAELRQQTANQLTANADEYREFIVLPDDRTLEDYIQDIRDGMEWASHVEIAALMQILKRPILAIGANGQIINADAINQFAGEPILVYYNGHDHYDALLLTEGLSSTDIVVQLMSVSLSEQKLFTDKQRNNFSVDSDTNLLSTIIEKKPQLLSLFDLLKNSSLLPSTPSFQRIQFDNLNQAKDFVAKLLEIGMGNRNLPEQVKKIEPAEDHFLVELTQKEWNALNISNDNQMHENNQILFTDDASNELTSLSFINLSLT